MLENHSKASKLFVFLILTGLHNAFVFKLLKLFHTFHETAIPFISNQIDLRDTIPLEGRHLFTRPFVVKAMQTPLLANLRRDLGCVERKGVEGLRDSRNLNF